MQSTKNLKQKAKKNLSADKVERMKMGGGGFVSKVDTVDEKVIGLLGHRANPLSSPYNGDASYNDKSGWSAISLLFDGN